MKIHKYQTKKQIFKKFNLKEKLKTVILLQHSETTEPEKSFYQICQTFEAILNFKINLVVIEPCSDIGYDGVIKGIIKYQKSLNFKLFKNLEAKKFHNLLKHSNLLIGNSSCGIIEAAYFNLPTINIGKRQKGRERSSNVIDVPHDKNSILKAIETCLYDKKFIRLCKKSKSIYGDGNAGKNILIF